MVVLRSGTTTAMDNPVRREVLVSYNLPENYDLLSPAQRRSAWEAREAETAAYVDAQMAARRLFGV